MTIHALAYFLLLSKCFIEIDNLQAITEATLVLMILTGLCTKTIRFTLKKKLFIVLEDLLSNIRINMTHEDNRNVIGEARKSCHCFSQAYRTIMFLGVFSNLALPLLSDNPRVLPLAMWTPWSILSNDIYILTYAWHMLVLFNGTLSNVTTDIMTNKLMVILISKLKVLKNDLNRIDYRQRDGSVQIQLGKCLTTHNQIIRLVSKSFFYATTFPRKLIESRFQIINLDNPD